MPRAGDRPRLLPMVLTADANLAVVFENRKMHVGDGRTTGRPKGRLELMLGQPLAVHYVAKNMPIVNDDLRFALNKLLQALASESR